MTTDSVRVVYIWRSACLRNSELYSSVLDATGIQGVQLGAHETQTNNFTDIGATVLRDTRYSTHPTARGACYIPSIALRNAVDLRCLGRVSALTLPTVLGGKHTDPVNNMTFPLVRFMHSCNYTQQY
jgi:hypothetical protein